MTQRCKQAELLGTTEAFLDQIAEPDLRAAAEAVIDRWLSAGHRRRLGPNHVVLEARGPSSGGVRTVVTIFSDGHVLVPFHSYAGSNTGIAIETLTTSKLREATDELFGFRGDEKMATTQPGWLTPDRVDGLLSFCEQVADAYRSVLIKPTTL